MNSLSKLTMLGSVLVASLAYADTVNLATTAAGLGANDNVIWSPQLGADGATIPNVFAATSTGARAVAGSFATTTGLVAKVCSGCSWSPLTGDFTNNDFIVWSFDNGTSSGTGPVTLTFPSVSGIGAVIQADAPGQFTAKIELFNGVTSLGFVTRTSNAAGDAIFIGALDITAPNANKAVISLTAAQNNGTPNFVGDFAMGPLSINAPAVVFTSSIPTKSFNPTSIGSGGSSVVTVALSNGNATPLTGGAFTDTLTNMSAVGGAVGGTCTGTTPNTLVGGATNLSFTGIVIPAGGCTVTFSVTSSTVGVNPNSTSGVTTTQVAAGAGSNTANLTVAALVSPVPTKSFNPTSIGFGGTSVVTISLSNGNATNLTGGAFTDTLTNMSAVGGAVGGTCTGTTPNTLGAGATNLSFTGIVIPPGGCTVTFSVTSSTSGANPNQTSGVTTTQTPAAGAASNVATLTVAAVVSPTPTKSFNPTSIGSGGSSVVTVSLSNGNAVNLTGGAFTDTLTNMSAVGGAVGGTCTGTTPNTLGAGATNLSFTGIVIPPGGCTVTFSVTSSTVGANPNSTSGVTTTQTPVAGAASNTATLTVTPLVSPTISKAFNPATISVGGTSTVTLTLSNSNAVNLTNGSFTDTLVNMSAAGGPVGGTCVGTTPNTLVAGATNLSFSGITIPAASSCTVTFVVTSNTLGVNTNQTSGVTTTQVTAAGPASNVATLTVTLNLSYQVRYASNLAIGDSVVNIVNNGANATGPISASGTTTANGNLCYNVYTFSPDEQLISCCSCFATPNSVVSLSARNDLISNTLTPGIPTSIVIKLVATQASNAASCNAATVGTGTNTLAVGMDAWGSTIHLFPVTPGLPTAGTYAVTESAFTKATLSTSELTRLTTMCGFIQSNGSGFGICKSCRFGGLGAVTQ